MRLKGFVLTGIALLLFVNTIFSQVQTARNIAMIPNSGGFYEYLPEGYGTGNDQYPLILSLHGSGEVGNGTTQLPLLLNNAIPKLIKDGNFPTSFTVNGQIFRFIVIAPQFIGAATPADVDNVLNYITQHYRVDQTRIYLTGLSMGGGSVWDYSGGSSVYANRLAAILPVCGASYPDAVRGRIMANANLPIWATHNNGDPTVPVSYTNDYIAFINSAPAPNPVAKKTIFPVNGHNAWTKTYDPGWREDGVMNVYEWMLQYTRPAAAPLPNQPPVAEAGPYQTISLPTSIVTLNGSATDADGTIASYSWSQVNGTAANITNPSSASTTITGLTSIGTSLFRLTVTDDKGATGVSYTMITVNPVPKAIPGRIEAESWDAKSGSQYAVATNDPSGGGQQVIGISNGNWMDYNVGVTTSGTYTVSFRVSTTQSSSQYQLKSGNTVLATFNAPNTGAWSNWTTASVTAFLTAGNQTLRIISTSNESSNLNWIEWTLLAASTAPSISTGPAQTIVLPVSQVSLSGSGMANNGGSIISHVWTKLNGGSAAITDPASYATTVTGLSAGIYTFRLTVTQDDNQSAASDVIITVNNAPPPTAAAGPAQTIILPLSQVTLAGNGTAGNGGSISYAWSQLSGTAASITSPSSASTTVTELTTTGIRVFRLTVTQDDNQISASDIIITVNNPAPPTVFAGAAQTIILPVSQVSLTGNGTAGNGGSLWYAWSQLSGTTATITNPSSASTTVTDLTTVGVRVFRLTVTQSDNQIATNDITITVNNPGPPTANAGQAQTISLPLSQANLTGMGTAGNGGSLTYVWSQLSGTAASITNSSSAATSVTGLTTVGVRVFRLTVTQSDNQTATSEVTITVNPAGASGKLIPGKIEAENWDAKSGGMYPVATGDVDGGQQVIGISNGSWMDYNVTVNQPGIYTANFRVATTQNNAQFQLKIGAGILATINVPNTGGWDKWITVPVSNITLASGAQTIRILSTSNESANLNWTDWVLAITSTVPVANAGLGQTITLPVSQVSLSGSGTANNGGSIISHAWSKLNGGPATITDPSSYVTTLTGLSAGFYTLRLTVTQDDNQTAISDVTITVNNAPPPMAAAGTAQTIILPVSQVSLTGSGTAGNGGSLWYAWSQLSGIAATITNPSSASTTVTDLTTVGARVFRLTVTQDDNQKATSDITITINNPGPPTANAGQAQTISLPLSQVNLTGTATAGNGGPITYAWSQLSGTAASITNSSSAATTIIGLTTAGVRVFRLTVTQSDNQTANSDVTITVNPAGASGKLIPGKIEAENWDAKSGGMYPVATGDAGGGQQVIGISNGSWMDYNVTVTEPGNYTANFRVATTQNNAQFQLKLGSAMLATVNIPNTGGWDKWVSVPVNNITLAAGAQTIRVLSTNNESCNFNWMDFTLNSQAFANNMLTNNIIPEKDQDIPFIEAAGFSSISIFPNPVRDQLMLRLPDNLEGIINIKIINAGGGAVKEMQANKRKGKDDLLLSTFGMTPGIYFINLSLAGHITTVKMIKL